VRDGEIRVPTWVVTSGNTSFFRERDIDMRTKILLVGSLVAALALGACGGKTKSENTAGGGGTGGGGGAVEEKKAPLFDRLGGLEGITKVVDLFLANVLADERINARFQNADGARLRQMLIDQICAATGGPCAYTGKNMQEAHAGMKITEDEWNALVEDLVKALDAAGVGAAEKEELLGALGGMKGDVVGI
jgi:hemoglobin